MRPLRDRLHAVYGFAHFGKSMLWNLSALYFAFYLTEVVGIPMRAMGWVMATSLVFNAVCDLLTGRWLSRFVHDGTAAARLQFKGSLLAAAAFVGFAMTGFVPDALRVAFSLVSLLLFRFGYSLMDVPQNSFMAFVAASDRERAALASTRYVAAGLSVLLITVVITPLVQVPDQEGQALMFFLLAAVVAPVTLCGGWLLHIAFRARPTGDQSAMMAKGRRTLAPRIDNRAEIFAMLLVCILFFSGLGSFFSKLESYLTAYVFQDSLAKSLFMPIVAVGQIIGQFAWPRIADHLGLPRMLMAACMGWLVSAGWLWCAIQGAPATILAAAFAYGATAGGVLMAIWSLLAQSCIAAPHRTAWRYGLFTFCSKLAQAAAILTIGEWLSAFDYRAATGAGNPLVVMGTVGPAVSAVIIAAIAFLIWQRVADRPAVGPL